MIRLNTSEHGGGGISEFQWSESEQVWPFETTASGNTLYCKQIYMGALPDTTTINYPHSIAGLDCRKVFDVDLMAYDEGAGGSLYFDMLRPSITQIYMTTTYIVVETSSNWSGYHGVCKLIYWK